MTSVLTGVTYYCPADTRYLSKTWRKGIAPHISQQNKLDRQTSHSETKSAWLTRE